MFAHVFLGLFSSSYPRTGELFVWGIILEILSFFFFFCHRFNIASDLTEWAKDAGELGLAGIFVWMRFMATRQLIWNKNYNVKPRYISYVIFI